MADIVLPSYILIQKRLGETPLAAIERLRTKRPELAGVILGYAGRLDPMARGQLLVLVGEENKNQAQYFGLSKTYEVTILFGVATDTGDILGLITGQSKIDTVTRERIGAQLAPQLKKYIGPFVQEYPKYSSKPVSGRPLFAYARSGKDGNIVIPTKEVEIYVIDLISYGTIALGELQSLIFERIGLVIGDFRQEEIVAGWQDFFATHTTSEWLVAQIRVSCSSGTYMRSLASRLGHDLGVSALALDIHRTQIGDLLAQNDGNGYNEPKEGNSLKIQ